MLNQFYLFDDYLFNLLKIELAKKIGFSITTKSECAKLSQLIFNAGFSLVSESTLYRIFIKNNNHKPHKSTLSILSEFIGKGDWDAFCESSTKKKIFNYQNGIINKPTIENNLVFQCIETEAFPALGNFLTKIYEADNEAQETMALTLYDSLTLSSKNIPFFKRFSNNIFVRKQFFENGFDPSFRIPSYDVGFEYYLKQVNPSFGLSDFQDFIFAKTALFRHYFLNHNYEKATAIGNEIYQSMDNNQNEVEQLYIFPRMRFIAYKLWYLKIIQTKLFLVEDYINYLLNYCDDNYAKLDFIEKRILFYTVGEAFSVSEVDIEHQNQLKQLFLKEYMAFPKYLLNKPIKEALPYFEPNGLLHRRPII